MSDHAGAPNVHTRGIAAFVSALSYDRIPAEVIERIKLLILDSLGCAIYGAQLEWCRILRQTLESLDATRTTSVWGTPLRLSSPHAALMNGTQVQGFELDDVHRQGVLHVGAVTLPALIAVAESHADLSGRDFLTAAVAGYEIGPASDDAWGRSISDRAGIPARPLASTRRPPAPRAGWDFRPMRRCTRSESRAPNQRA
jgi:aconitate decarboxylase